MNGKLRRKMQDIVDRLLMTESVTEAEIKLVRRSLLLADIQQPEDRDLIRQFYFTVRQHFFALRYPISDKRVLAARSDRPADDKLETAPQKITYKAKINPWLDMALPVLWESLCTQCQHLQVLITAAGQVQTVESYLPQANEIVATHRQVLQLAHHLPSPELRFRQRVLGGLQDLYDRLEELGWQCTAGEAIGLRPANAKNLLRFSQAFLKTHTHFYFPMPDAPGELLAKVMATLAEYVLQGDKLVLKPKPAAEEKSVGSTHKQKRKLPSFSLPVQSIAESDTKRLKSSS